MTLAPAKTAEESPPRPAPPRRPTLGQRLMRAVRGSSTPVLLLAGPFLFLGVMIIWPLIEQVYLSLTNARLTNPSAGDFVGLRNYTAALTGEDLPQVLLNTLIYTVGTTVIALILGVLAAVVVNVRFAGNAVVKAILAAPWAIPSVAAALIWLWMFSQSRGVLNRGLEALGQDGIAWLTTEPWAMIAVIMVTAWQAVPFVMLVTLAALKSVPQETAEASRIDGASRLGTFQWVIWPHILPTVRLLAILQIIEALRKWDIIAVLTEGGPVNSTNTLVIAIQRQAFEYHQLGMGATYAIIGITIAILFTLVYLLLERREERRDKR